MEITVTQLAEALNGTVDGDGSLVLGGIVEIQNAAPGQLAFLANKKYEHYLKTTRASAVIVDRKTSTERLDLILIHTDDPYLGFVKALGLFYPWQPFQRPGIHPSAVVDETAEIGEGVSIGASAVVGAHAVVGRASTVGACTVLGDRVAIGEDCLIYPNVTIIAGASLGNRVIIHSGTVVGSDGFGFAPTEERYQKVPQVGTVVIEDDVEIGSNCSVDRATIGCTRIRRGAKIDNLIQIAHNVVVGEDTVIAAQSGISGSTTLGSHVIVAGQVGIVGHVEIADSVTIGAQSGVSKSISEAGKVFRGSPAREIHDELRQEAAMRRLPDLIEDVRRLEQHIAELRAATGIGKEHD